MATFIPFVPGMVNYRLVTTIDGVTYIFDTRWNARDAAWYFDLLEEDETPIIYGVKVVLGTYLGRRSTHSFFRGGVLAAWDTSGQDLDAGIDDLGSRVQLVHYSALEVVQGRGLNAP